MANNVYEQTDVVDAEIRTGRHRDLIGGLWEQMGPHQLSFLIAQGMQPSHRLLDIGCGALRLGVHAIPYLEASRYYGSDVSEAIMRAGHELELDDDGRARAPWTHFRASPDFDLPEADGLFDYAIAQSVFTHLPLNHLRRCLARLAPRMASGGRFFVTYFECQPDQDLFDTLEQPGGIVRTTDTIDPFHYRLDDLIWAIDRSPWTFEPIGDWGHPRGQMIAAYRRR
ncbi:class I SAM-dependent methyltransferase [Brevundimonas sp.]|uniref:class I SAM-dependent methyltransferase n=1 Tax=Brevundimonas sp. TaxID=1871086 RepID=UPI00260824ED|nr:class I SAM-dependent methyltransferase [Brevundimonas sp.]